MRKLASIQKISSLSPIKDADKIEVAKILGWQCVVKKGEFKDGELGCYFEIDSLLDETNPAFDFLRKDGKLKKIKTIELKKTLSQGIILPLTILSHYGKVFLQDGNYFLSISKESGIEEVLKLEEGLDLTEITKTTLWEPIIPAQLAGLIRGNFPSWIRKTDEPRIQNFPTIISECVGIQMVGAMKIDGTSSTYYIRDGEFGVCSRGLDLKEDYNNTYWKMAQKYDIKNKMIQFQNHCSEKGIAIINFAIQGEIYGEGIQGNKLGIRGQELALFSFFDIDKSSYRSHRTLQYFCEITGLKMVPVVCEKVFTENDTYESLFEMSNNLKYPNGSPAEGIVWRPSEQEIRSEIIGGRLSFKCISNIFLLKEKEQYEV